ncbi:hypothetical protein OCEANICA350_11580 [Oceanicaulis sp. 350]|nr:hypothetical protein OCEANICA350_11580 [Oceanicaulis sp. 350]
MRDGVRLQGFHSLLAGIAVFESENGDHVSPLMSYMPLFIAGSGPTGKTGPAARDRTGDRHAVITQTRLEAGLGPRRDRRGLDLFQHPVGLESPARDRSTDFRSL